jgi:hypothetical protein
VVRLVEPDYAVRQGDWTIGSWDAIHPLDLAAYVNFMGDKGDARVRATSGNSYERLGRFKAAYRRRRFSVNQNIRPQP